MSLTVDKIVHLSPGRAKRLAQLAQQRSATEDALSRATTLSSASSSGGSHRHWRSQRGNLIAEANDATGYYTAS